MHPIQRQRLPSSPTVEQIQASIQEATDALHQQLNALRQATENAGGTQDLPQMQAAREELEQRLDNLQKGSAIATAAETLDRLQPVSERATQEAGARLSAVNKLRRLEEQLAEKRKQLVAMDKYPGEVRKTQPHQQRQRRIYGEWQELQEQVTQARKTIPNTAQELEAATRQAEEAQALATAVEGLETELRGV